MHGCESAGGGGWPRGLGAFVVPGGLASALGSAASGGSGATDGTEPADHGLAGDAIGADHQDGVVASHGPGDVVDVGLVERDGERVRVARRGAQHHQVAGGHRRFEPQAERPFQLLTLARFGFTGVRQGVDQASLRVADLDRAEVFQVARDRCLGGVEALQAQQLQQACLATDLAAAQQRGERPLSGGLGRHAPTSSSAPPRRARPSSTAAASITRGGAIRRADSVTGLTTSPRLSAALATSLALPPLPSSRASHRPWPRTSAPSWSWAKPARKPSRPSRRRPATSSTWPLSSGSITSSVASAAAQATGLPPKVVPWSPGRMVSATSSVAMVAPIG